MAEELIPEELGFAEFAARLIEESFAAIISSGLDQQRALDALAGEAALSLDAYAARSIAEEEVTEELARLFPTFRGRPYTVTAGAPYAAATSRAAEEPAFAAALGVTLGAGDVRNTRQGAVITEQGVAALRAAAARRLAAPAHAALRGLIRLGAPRIVIDAGTIKARLVFRVVRLEDAAKPAVKSRLAAPLRPLAELGGGMRAAAPPGLAALRFTVRQASDRAPQTSQLSADVFGEVELRFKTVT